MTNYWQTGKIYKMGVLKKGLVQVYTGPGKGKTTAAFGLAWRMMGNGGRVYICQFLKPADRATGEAALAQRFDEQLTLDRFQQEWNLVTSFNDSQQVQAMQQAISEKMVQIKQTIETGKYDLVILDEIVFCLSKDLAQWPDVLEIIDSRPGHVELVLTGRDADEQLIDRADLVTNMQEIKHPYQQGTIAREGIEY